MNHCIEVPAAQLRLEAAPVRLVLVHTWSYTERMWVQEVCEAAVTSGAGFAQALAAFTGRMKADGRGASTEGASRPFLFGVSRG